MIDILTLLAPALVLLGAGATLLCKNIFNKLISLGLLTAGAVLFFVKCGYVDVAAVVSVLMPVGTIFLLLLLGKKKATEAEK